MNISNLINELASTAGKAGANMNTSNNFSQTLKGASSKMPGGFAGGAVAGGLVAALLSSKSARKKAGKAAKYGGAAVLGGLAYKAYKDWQSGSHTNQVTQAQRNVPQTHVEAASRYQSEFEREALAHMNGAQVPLVFEMTLIKAMIASARADGQIDADEQRRISEAVNKLSLDAQAKSDLLNLFIQPINLSELVADLESIEQKAEVYLASCLAIDLDHQAEYQHLSDLAKALDLPPGLEHSLRSQAATVTSEVA